MNNYCLKKKKPTNNRQTLQFSISKYIITLFFFSFLYFTYTHHCSYAENVRDVIKKVLDNSPEMKIASYDKKMSTYDKKISMSAFFPTINFDTIFTNQTSRNNNTITKTEKTEKKSGSINLGLSYPFFNSGASILQYKISDLFYTSQEFSEDTKRREMIYEAVNAYITVLETTLIQKVYKKTVQSAKTQLDIAKEKFQLGSYSKRELADMSSKYSNTYSQYVQFESERDFADIKYQNLVGESPLVETFEQPAMVFNPESLIEPLEKAVKYNPSANQAGIQRKISNLQRKQTFVSQHLPYGSLKSTWKLKESSEDYFDFNKKNDTSLSVDFTIPLFNGLYGVYNVKKANTKALQAEESRIKTLRDLNTNVSNLWYQLKKSHTIAIAKKEEIESNRLQLEATKSERDLNTQTDLDVLDAEIEWIESKVDLIRAEYNSVRLSYKLLLLVGDGTDLLELY